MGTKVTVDNITNVTNSSGVPTINTNFDTVADEFDKVVYRDGSQAITNTIDMDSNRLINLPQAIYATEPLRKGEGDLLLSQAEAMLNAAVLGENYHETVAAGVAATAVGDLFVSDEGGVFKVYKKTGTPPNYEEILVPASQTEVDALAAIVDDLGSSFVDGVEKNITSYGGTFDLSTNNSAALSAALSEINGRTYPGGILKFNEKRMYVTSSFTIGDETELDFGGCNFWAAPSGDALFSYGWGTTGAGNQIARPVIKGGQIRVSGVGKTAIRMQNVDSPLIRDTSIDILNANSVGIHVKANDDPASPYYGIIDGVRVSGGGNPVPGDGRIGILFEHLKINGSYGINRWFLNNLRHIAAVDIGLDIRGADGLTGNNINLEACYETGVRFGYDNRSYTGNITSLIGNGTAGFKCSGFIGTTLDSSGTLVVNTGPNAGFSVPVYYIDPVDGSIVLAYGLPAAFVVGNNITYTEAKARNIVLNNVTYEGSSYNEDFVHFTPGARGCVVRTAFQTMPSGNIMRRDVEDDTNTVASHYETVYFEGTLTSGTGTEWLHTNHFSSLQGGYLVTRGNTFIDSVYITGSVRGPDDYDGVIEAKVYVNAVEQGINPKLTRISPNKGLRVRKLLAPADMLIPGHNIKVAVDKTGLAVGETVIVAVRIGYLGT